MVKEVSEDSRSIAEGGEGIDLPESDPPLGGAHPFLPASDAGHLHSISDNQSQLLSTPEAPLTHVNGPLSPLESTTYEGEGVKNPGMLVLGEDVEMAPLDVLNKNG